MLDSMYASWIVQAVMGLLVLASVASWAIMLFKARELRAAEADTEELVQAYQERSLDAAYDVARECSASPLSAVFVQGYKDLTQLRKLAVQAMPPPEELESIVRRLEWTQLVESQRSERGLAFLATTGSIAPFVGLFGTVVGIMDAFAVIGETGVASLATVGPPISEALLATAVGLFAAIPAVVGYNYLSARSSRLVEQLETFRADFAQYLRGYLTRAA